MARDTRRMTFIVVPQGAGDLSTRSFEISYRRLRVVAGVLLLALVAWIVSMSLFLWVLTQAARVPGLTQEVERLEAERHEVERLAASLEEIERQYARVRQMLGADRVYDPSGIWLPPAEPSASADALADSAQASTPSAWPLTQRGFVTREHLGQIPGQHPGIDIAVAEGAYVRAAGAGFVTAAGEDSVYGKFVRLEHADGYQSVYGHASELFVEADQWVERHEVIALTGNTGKSTAPHLHFEVWKDGEPIDPRSVVDVPG